MSNRYLLIVLVLFGCTTSYKINEKEVERILTVLSSDEMGGRTLNSEGIEKAATFIANEFESIGLAEIREAKSYKQHFNINSTSVEVAKIEINGQPIGSKSYFAKVSGESISWNKEKMPDIMFVKEEDDFRQTLGAALSSDKDLLIVISDVHKTMFDRYYAYFSKPSIGFGDVEMEPVSLVFVLSNTDAVNNLEVEAAIHMKEQELTNVIGVIEGNRLNEMVVYSSHYDHLGIGTPVDGDSIYNGANDDASGVTAVIELARYFKNQPKPERTLVFVAFTAEEVGGFGSQYFSKQLNPNEIVAMLNIEMIGKESKVGLNSAWMSGWDKSDLGEILKTNLNKIDFKFFADPYPKQNLFYRSDNATLARLGVPAHSISTTQIDIDTDYHQLSDEIETLDITNITNTIKAIAVGSQGIVNGAQTPSRIDPNEVKK